MTFCFTHLCAWNQVWTPSSCTWAMKCLRSTSPSVGAWPTPNPILSTSLRTSWLLPVGSSSPMCSTGKRFSGKFRSKTPKWWGLQTTKEEDIELLELFWKHLEIGKQETDLFCHNYVDSVSKCMWVSYFHAALLVCFFRFSNFGSLLYRIVTILFQRFEDIKQLTPAKCLNWLRKNLPKNS